MNDLQIYFHCNTFRLYLELIKKLGKIHARRDVLPGSIDNNLHSTSEMTGHPNYMRRTGHDNEEGGSGLPAAARTAVGLAFSIV